MKFNPQDLFLAEVRWLNKGWLEKTTAEIPHVILLKKEDKRFANVLNVLEKYPYVLKVYSENEYNQIITPKIALPLNIRENGPIYVVDEQRPLSESIKEEQIEWDDILDYVLESPDYFKERKDIIKARLTTLKCLKNIRLLLSTYYKDSKIEKDILESDLSIKEYIKNKTYICK